MRRPYEGAEGKGMMAEQGGIVDAKRYEGWGWSPLSLVGLGPKFVIRCGRCQGDFTRRLVPRDEPHERCPYCGTINRRCGLTLSCIGEGAA